MTSHELQTERARIKAECEATLAIHRNERGSSVAAMNERREISADFAARLADADRRFLASL